MTLVEVKFVWFCIEFIDSELYDLDLFGTPGWQTQDFRSNRQLKKFKVATEDFPFVGFGRCRAEEVSADDFNIRNPIEDQIRSYLIPLRAQCHKPLVSALVKIYEHGGLSKGTLSWRAKHDFFKIVPNWDIL